MTDPTCIVCLGDLRVATKEAEGNDASLSNDELHLHDAHAHSHATDQDAYEAPTSALGHTVTANTSKQAEDDEIIAHLLPCGHNMHDSCLRPWVERANSCPICRAQFNMVELRKYLDAPAFSSYTIQDKQQQADVDPTLIVDDDLFEAEDPCLVCGLISPDYDVMYCDGCDRTVHVFCAGYNDAPEIWYCETCLDDDLVDTNTRPTSMAMMVPPNGTAQAARHSRRSRRGRRVQVSEWDRVWQQVWNRLNIDLNNPYHEAQAEDIHTVTQQAEFHAWQNRLNVANRQGGANRFRDTASTLLRRRPPIPQVELAPETPEEMRAWNDFDRVMHVANADRPSNRRKRKSTTNSPVSPRDSDAAPERKLKRPRTRRNLMAAQAGPSNVPPAQPAAEQPSFLKSLLQEVEKQHVPAEPGSPEDDNSADEHLSPYVLSPGSSPLQSGLVSPRATSVTPPPQVNPRPSSPIMPLTSVAMPRYASPPYSPVVINTIDRTRPRARSPVQPSSPMRDASPSSPSRGMSYSTKTEIQRMVKAALGTRYKDKQITKDQYTDINRDVSRTMYDKVGDAEGLADQEGRDKWQHFANDEVERAVEAIRAQLQHDDTAASSTSS